MPLSRWEKGCGRQNTRLHWASESHRSWLSCGLETVGNCEGETRTVSRARLVGPQRDRKEQKGPGQARGCPLMAFSGLTN